MMIYLIIIGAVILLGITAVIVYLILRSAMGSMNINVEEGEKETILTIDPGNSVTNLVITATVKNGTRTEKLVSKRKVFGNDSDSIKITYKLPIKKIEVSYIDDGRKEKWDYKRQ